MSVQIEKIGRISYAFGMNWVEVEQADLKSTLEDLDDKSDQVNYLVQGASKAGLFGFGRKSTTKIVLGTHAGDMAGKVASYAATLATVADNGFYVARVNDDLLWYCSIFNGRIIPGSDKILPKVTVVENIRELLSNYAWVLHADEYAASVFGREGFDVLAFDPIQAVAKAKPAYLTRLGTSKGEIVAATVLGLAAIVGFGWLYTVMFPKPPVNTGPTPEEIREMYLSALRTNLPALSADPLWASQAFEVSRSSFPAFRSGWTLQAVSCSPRDGCSANYAPMSDGVWFSHEAFGVASRTTKIASRSARTPTSLLQPTDDELLYSFPAYGRPAGEVAGVFGLRFAAAALQGEPLIEDMSGGTGAQMPEGAVQLFAEKIVVGQSSVPDIFLIRKVTAYFSEEGFRPSQFVFSHGYGAQNSAWRMEFIRLRSAG